MRDRIRSTSGNAVSTLVARGATTLAQAVAFSVVGKTYGAHALDHYALGFTIATFASLLLDFGTSTWITRELARTGHAPGFVVARIPLALGMLAGASIAVVTGTIGLVEMIAIAVMATALAVSLFGQGIFWGNLLHEREMAFSILETCLVLAFLVGNHFGVLPGHEPLLYTAAGYALGAIGRCFAFPKDRRPDFGALNVPEWWKTMHSFGMQSIVTVASTQLDTILLSIFLVNGKAGTVAAYALSMRVYYAAPMPLQAVAAALLPRFVREPGRHKRDAIRGTVMGSVLAASGVAVFVVIVPIFGYGPVVVEQLRTVMEVLTIAFFARCVAYVLGAFVTAQGGQRARLWSSVASLTTMVSLDLALIPGHGAVGAALAMVAADWVLLVGYTISAVKITTRRRVAALAK
jgi:O-antigen/teichoic acid export membrane protein